MWVATISRSPRSTAQMAMMWSPVTSRPFLSTSRARSASPSKVTPTSKPPSTTRLTTASGLVEPQPTLMFSPSGRAFMTSSLAPILAKTRGATM